MVSSGCAIEAGARERRALAEGLALGLGRYVLVFASVIAEEEPLLATTELGVWRVAGLGEGTRARAIGYWVTTAIYPAYFLVLLEIGKWMAGVVIVAPRLPRAKEWA